MTGPELRALREQHGWGVLRLAKAMAVSPVFISMLEHGTLTMEPHTAQSIKGIFSEHG